MFLPIFIPQRCRLCFPQCANKKGVCSCGICCYTCVCNINSVSTVHARCHWTNFRYSLLSFFLFFFLTTFYFLFLFTGTISLKRPFQLFFYMFVDISLTAVSMDSFNYTAYTELDLKWRKRLGVCRSFTRSISEKM